MPKEPKRPLGLLQAHNLDAGTRQSLIELEQFDFSPVRRRLIENGIMPATWVDDAILEFKRFIALIVLTQRWQPMISRSVDEVWHTCLLYTRLYSAMCDRVAGQFIHHDPVEDDTTDGERESAPAFLTVYEQYFGQVGEIWFK
jgi:hypothetical protein